MEQLERIYVTYRDFVYRICSRYARNAADAEDLTQETFIKIACRLDGFRGESEFGTWIYRVAVNRCLDALRRRRNEERNLQSYLDEMVLHNLAPDGDRVLAKLILNRILGKVRPLLRQTLFLTLAEGLSCAEAAAILRITPAAAAKSVSRFLKKHGAAGWEGGNPEKDGPRGGRSENTLSMPSKTHASEGIHHG